MTTLETTQTVPLTIVEGGAIRITGTRVSLDVVIHHYQQGESPEEIQGLLSSARTGWAEIWQCSGMTIKESAPVTEACSTELPANLWNRRTDRSIIEEAAVNE